MAGSDSTNAWKLVDSNKNLMMLCDWCLAATCRSVQPLLAVAEGLAPLESRNSAISKQLELSNSSRNKMIILKNLENRQQIEWKRNLKM